MRDPEGALQIFIGFVLSVTMFVMFVAACSITNPDFKKCVQGILPGNHVVSEKSVKMENQEKKEEVKGIVKQEYVTVEEVKESENKNYYAIVETDASKETKLIDLDSESYKLVKKGDKILCNVTYKDGEIANINFQ